MARQPAWRKGGGGLDVQGHVGAALHHVQVIVSVLGVVIIVVHVVGHLLTVHYRVCGAGGASEEAGKETRKEGRKEGKRRPSDMIIHAAGRP